MRALAFAIAFAMLAGHASAELQLHYVAEVQAGRNATVVASISSNVTASMPVTASLPCCDVQYVPSVSVAPGSDTTFTLKVHAPLNGTAGYHTLTVFVGNYTKSMIVHVKESDLVARIPGLALYSDTLRSKLDSSTDDVRMLLDAASDRLAKARKAVQDDDEAGLYTALLAAERKLYYEAPAAMNAASNAATLRRFLWVPALVIAAAAGLVMLRLRGI